MVEKLRLALTEFANLCDASRLRERHGHKTPAQIRAEQNGLETEAATVKWQHHWRKAPSHDPPAVHSGLDGSTAALASRLTLATAINCIGIGFQRGTHTRGQMVADDGTVAPTRIGLRASFNSATGGAMTLFIAAPSSGRSIRARVIDEVTGAVFEQEVVAGLSANTQFLSPRLFMNNGATAAAIAYDRAGVYLETDF